MILLKSKLRKRIEFHIEMINDSIKVLRNEMKDKGIKQTLNPKEYAKYSIKLNDLNDDLKLLKELL
jgi:hypothetical protein